ncbi:hydrolase [Natranaerofaba carboxydovora]|uniref:hydrolase n=1 Tax=Natranaerofaba carboxydovora TaxID=2742683 RepID=UPI001F12DB9A|nr:hydrolase [Natranaerofaba carboxydovora]UMZ73760.1 Isochorismatase family protein [Natranaerofaba carboxydovora]
MVIDIQEKLLPSMKYGNQIIEKTNILTQIANKLGMPVIATEQYPKGLGRTVERVTKYFDQVKVFEKMTFSSCTEELLSYLKENGKKKIIVSGMETHVCVYQTVRDLLKEGYQVFVVNDGVCSRKKEDYFNGLALMQEMGAVIINTESVFFDLMKEAGTPEFKELSPLIK